MMAPTRSPGITLYRWLGARSTVKVAQSGQPTRPGVLAALRRELGLPPDATLDALAAAIEAKIAEAEAVLRPDDGA